MKKIVAFHPGASDKAEGLEVRSSAGRLQPQAFITLFNQMCRQRQSSSAVTTPLHLRGRKMFHVIQVTLAGSLCLRDPCRAEYKSEQPEDGRLYEPSCRNGTRTIGSWIQI